MARDQEIPGAPLTTPRLVPAIFDSKAEATPDAPCLYKPRSSSTLQRGFEAVSWKKIANAINHAGNWLRDTIGVPEPNTFPTVAYLGPSDARYYALLVGAEKAGFKALFVSPRNIAAAQISLLEKTQCDHFIVSPSFRPQAEQWLKSRPSLKLLDAPSYDTWFTDSHIAKHIPYTKTYEEAKHDPMVVLHTSGSTGIPKPVISPHGMICIADLLHNLPSFNGLPLIIQALKNIDPQRTLLAMPLFHAAGIYIFLLFSVYWDMPIVLGLPDKPLSMELISDYLRHSEADAAVIPPAILAQMSEDGSCTQQLKRLKSVAYGGGSLPPEAGWRLVEHGVKIQNWIATTETAPYLQYHQSVPENWQYYIFNPDIIGIDFRRINSTDEPKGSENDIYRMVIKRYDTDPSYQGWFYTFPDNEEYDTQDLFRPHPTLPHHWQHAGRRDDIIVFSNGEKLNPTSIEGMLLDSPDIKGAVVVGSGKFQAGLVVEPVHDGDDQLQFVETIWPLVQKANDATVTHGRIARHMIMVAKSDKPFPRAGKGTVQRAGTLKLYEQEIEELYEVAEHGDLEGASAIRLEASSEDALVASITAIFLQAVSTAGDAGESGLSFDADTDLFSVGVDSLMVINASRLLRKELETAGMHDITPKRDAISTRAFYANPTPRQLAQHILRSFSSGGSSLSQDRVITSSASTPAQKKTDTERAIGEMQAFLDKFTTDLPQPVSDFKPASAKDNQIVIVTGTTGLLGSHILENLLNNPLVRRVVCLNRAADGGLSNYTPTKQRRDNGHSDYSDDERVEFLHAATTDKHLGLSPEVYSRLLSQTDRIIHNAWPVNFNLALSSFANSLQGVRNIADFATACAKKPAVVFVSSIASVFGYTDSGAVPEKRFTDFRVAVSGGGYGQSKMVGSLILDAAAAEGGFDAATVRLGQIAGCESEDGLNSVWNRHEWLPSLVAGSLYLGVVPRTLGTFDKIDWAPIERMAGLCCDVAGVNAGGVPAGYYHGANPQVVQWEDLRLAVQEFYEIPKVVELDEWVEMMEESRIDIERTTNQAEMRRKMQQNPGVKILDTYRGIALGHGGSGVSLDVRRSVERSEALRTMQPVSPELMKKWCAQWAF